LNNYGVGVVIRSEKHDIQPGVHLYGNFGMFTLRIVILQSYEADDHKLDFQEYTIQSDPVQFYGSSGTSILHILVLQSYDAAD
jgi:hypothetical protein